VLIRVKAAAVNPADLKVLTHKDGGRFLHASKFPLVLGFDFSGVVETASGGHAAGDEVYGFLPYSMKTRGGSFAEYVVAKADEVGPKSKLVSHEQAAAAATVAMTALQSLRDLGRLAAGGSVLIHGASGGVGGYAVQIAKLLGAGLVVGTASAAKAEMVKGYGADRVVDYKTTPLTSITERFDIVYDVASKSSFGESAPLLNAKGTYVTQLPTLTMVTGMIRALFSSKRSKFIIAKSATADLAQVSRWFDEGKLSPILDQAYPLADVPKALERLRAGDVRGKLAITI
jgi:NADPH:quinone reductase-like Zn-dependent oxidoreductase